MPVLMFESWILNEICIIDLSSASVGLLIMSSSKLFFFERSSLNSGARLLLELYCRVISHRACCLIQFTLLLQVVVVISDLNKDIGKSKDLEKKSTDWWIFTHLFTPIHKN